MTNVRPNAISLAVAVVISSSIITTDAVADRRLQTRSVDILSNGHVEFIQSEVMIQPTLGHDQQPIPKSFTTTYPDQTRAREGYDVPSEGFTDVFSGIDGGVSSVDLFETGENDVAQKYTKVLKVSDEEVFRITHNLAEKKLIIEVRKGMTDQDSIVAVRAQLGDNLQLEPLTKIASPEQLAGVLRGAHERAGNLGEADNYSDLVTIEVGEVEVNGRTFMRLIAGGNQLPKLQRLGQSLFVNDEALLAATTSAYIQVHVLGNELHQNTLDALLSYQKPVGYVVHVEDETQLYPVPAGYPKLEVSETPGAIIVFRGQKQNPADVAFVEALHYIWDKSGCKAPTPQTTARVIKDKAKSYQYVIRSRQMAMLEEFAERRNAGVGLSQEYDEKLGTLAFFENLQQALTSATSVAADEFELTIPHVGFTSLYILPTWMHIQFVKHFSFKPALRNFLTSQHFVQDTHEVMPAFNKIYSNYFCNDPSSNSFDKGGRFASRFIGDFAGELLEMESELEKLKTKEARLATEGSFIRATKAVLTAALGIEPSEENTPEDRFALESTLHTRLFRLAELETELDDIRTPGHPKAMPEVLETLSDVEKALEMSDLDENNDAYLRRQEISEDMHAFIRNARQRLEEAALDLLKVTEETLNINISEEDDKITRLTRILGILDDDNLSDGLLDEIDNTLWTYQSEAMDEKDLKFMKLIAHLRYKFGESGPDQRATEQQQELLEAIEEILNIRFNGEDDKATRLAWILTVIDDDDIPESTLDQIHQSLWKEARTTLDDRGLKLKMLHASLNYNVEDLYLDEQAKENQINLLNAIEFELGIHPHKSVAAKKRGRAFTAKLAKDLNVAFAEDDNLSNQKDALRTKIQSLMDELHNVCDEGIKRAINNEMAHQLDIKDYKEDTPIDDQKNLIAAKLQQLDNEVFNAGQPDVDERIEAIEVELDKLMARLGPEPRYVLDRNVANARRVLEQAERVLAGVRSKLSALCRKKVVILTRPELDLAIANEDAKPLIQAIKQIQIELGLPADGEQTIRERIDDIRHFLRGEGANRRNEIFDKLQAAAKTHNIRIKSDLGLLEDDDYYIAIAAYANALARDKTNEVEDELSLTRKKYTQVTEFLHEHDRRSMEVTNARLEETKAQEDLDRERQKMIDVGGVDLPDLVLKQKSEAVSKAENALRDYHRTALDTTEEAAGLKPETSDSYEDRINALRKKRVKLGGDNGTGGKIWQLIQQARLGAEIDAREADIKRMKQVLKAARKAAENDGGPFQYTPEQAKARATMDTFTQQHSLKQQALNAAMGLAELAVESSKTMHWITTFDFDDELAPIRLRAMVGDNLAFDQASRIVEIFRRLKTSFPEPGFKASEDQPLNVLEEIYRLVLRARNEMGRGAQQYDDEIHGMSKRAIHFVEHEPGSLKSFSEYFAARSASGNRFIALVREGLISKDELENYIKAVRGVDDYHTVDEFEHLLGYKQGIKVPEFRKVVQMLSDKGAEEFMQCAFNTVTVTAAGPAGMKVSVAGMKEYAVAIIANYVLDDIAFENGRRTAAFLANIQDTLTPYAAAAGLSESDLIKAIHDTLMQAHAAAVEHQLSDYWVKPSAFLVQAVTWYYSSYKPLLMTRTGWQAAGLSLSNMSFLYLLDLTNRGDYTHRMLTPFQHWLQRYGVDLDRSGQYNYHSGIEKISEVGGLAMPLGKTASSAILLRTGSMLFARQHYANPHSYRSISRLVPEIVKSMGSGQGVQVPLLNRVTPQKVKTLASATAGLVLGPIATSGAYAHGLISGFTCAQTFGLALTSSLTFDFFMNDNKMLTQWLGGPLGRSLDRINRWIGVGETRDQYVKRTAIASPQGFRETDEEYANRVKASDRMHGWTRHENYLQFRERRDHTMKLFENGWEKYFRENVPKWSFSHAESVPYFYTLGAFYERQKGDDQKVHGHDNKNASQSNFLPAAPANYPN
ncbi:hypothetical protein [Endozoicomonas sp. 8E]|uniref:hypothetical protein n=1 Tax=Endozoicomonas sp. 8E TaxID=3035692 RepID=UPI00293938FD|nr:hypothetical protein [Endozoicomonas sp. 8E]WOG29597.1 hypothetical protein P6910_08075 [Endozoicomonas sp. 8E]